LAKILSMPPKLGFMTRERSLENGSSWSQTRCAWNALRIAEGLGPGRDGSFAPPLKHLDINIE
jgi:hypothetical protein